MPGPLATRLVRAVHGAVAVECVDVERVVLLQPTALLQKVTCAGTVDGFWLKDIVAPEVVVVVAMSLAQRSTSNTVMVNLVG